jgi:diaminohydroxyphosphoribosylaminopyrimidine deaminase/5-amino-6-(5-phosphoribosylamino)uracil reductase
MRGCSCRPPRACWQPPGAVRIYTADASAPAADRLREQGAQVVEVAAPQGRIDLAALLQDLAGQGVNELHVEAGARLNASWLTADLVDELLVYLAPMFIGPGRGMAALDALPDLVAAGRFTFFDSTPMGDDLRLRARRVPV